MQKQERVFPIPDVTAYGTYIFCEIFCSSVVWKKDVRNDLKVNCESVSLRQIQFTFHILINQIFK